MKDYIELITKKNLFISSIVNSYNTLIKNKKTKNNYNRITKAEQGNKNLSNKDIISHFYSNMKNNKIYEGYKIAIELISEKAKSKENNYIITTEKYPKDFFEVVEINFNVTKQNQTIINSINLAKELLEEKLTINVNIKKEFIELYIRSTNKQGFGIAKLSFFNNKIDKGEMIEELPKLGSFKDCLSFFNRINDLGYIEEIIDFLILNKDFTEEELNLYLIAYDLDFKKEFENPLRVNFKENNGMFIINKKCYNNLK